MTQSYEETQSIKNNDLVIKSANTDLGQIISIYSIVKEKTPTLNEKKSHQGNKQCKKKRTKEIWNLKNTVSEINHL